MNWIVLFPLIFLAAPAPAPAPAPADALAAAKPAMSDIIARWRDVDFAVRDRATADMLAHWEAWTAEDLKLLEAAQGRADAELAVRARHAADVIWLRRRLIQPTELLKDERKRVYAIVQAHPEATDLFLVHANPAARARAVTAIGWTGRAAMAGLVAARLDDPDPRVRAEAALAIYRLDATGHVAAVGRLLGDREDRVRAASAAALRLWYKRLASMSGGDIPEPSRTVFKDRKSVV